MTTPTPKCRRFRFSLRTLIVVMSVGGCWLGYSIDWINKRHAYLAHPEVIREYNDTPPSTVNRWGNTWPINAPRGLWLLGERGLVSVWLPPEFWSQERQAEAERLFPEALILRVNAKGYWVSKLDPHYSDMPPQTNVTSAPR